MPGHTAAHERASKTYNRSRNQGGVKVSGSTKRKTTTTKSNNNRTRIQDEKQKEFDIAKFDQQFTQLQGQTKTRILFSGAELSGSGLRILRQNAEQAEIEKDIIEYNANINKARKFEEANFARMQGVVARNQARSAEFGYYAQAGTSLLTGFGE